jgi:hypothetical protein
MLKLNNIEVAYLNVSGAERLRDREDGAIVALLAQRRW